MGEDASEQKDEEIVHLVQSGKIELFSVLIKRYENKIRRYAKKFLSNKEDINDVVQDIFLKAYANIQSFDLERRFSSWFYRIAHNELINVLKKRNKKTLSFFDLDTFLPHSLSRNNIDNGIKRKEIKEMVDKCLDKLEVKYREPIILYYLEELSYKEIADVMQIPISTVGVRIKRGKKKLKTIYKKLGYEL